MASYQLKITLLGIQPEIWRRFVVPSDTTLADLHEVIQSVMGWTDSHMHHFFDKKNYYMPSAFCDDDELPEETHTLEMIAPRKGSKFRYLYDFGDSWEHEIVVENVNFSSLDWPHPICCIEGERACPPDDCGGIYGYYDFCEAMAYSNHPEHEELKESFGGIYVPDFWDMEETNTAFKIKRKTRRPTHLWIKVDNGPWPPTPKEQPAPQKPVKKSTKKAAKKTAKKAAKKKP